MKTETPPNEHIAKIAALPRVDKKSVILPTKSTNYKK